MEYNGIINKFYAVYGMVMTRNEITPLPTVLFQKHRELGFSMEELGFLCQILVSFLTNGKEQLFFGELSSLTGADEAELKALAEALQEKGFLQKANPDGVNITDLCPLFQRLVEDNSSFSRGAVAGHKENNTNNRDLIAELTRKLHTIPGVEKLKGHYPMVGQAYNRYGYQAVAAAIEDLELEITGMRDLGMFQGTVPEKELTRMFFARCKWNYRPPVEGEKPRAGPKKQMTREIALAMGCIHDPENNRIMVTPEALENLRRAKTVGEI